MHILQPKHTRLKPEEAKTLLAKYNLSVTQLPKIKKTDASAPEGCETGDILKIERRDEEKTHLYFRVVA